MFQKLDAQADAVGGALKGIFGGKKKKEPTPPPTATRRRRR